MLRACFAPLVWRLLLACGLVASVDMSLARTPVAEDAAQAAYAQGYRQGYEDAKAGKKPSVASSGGAAATAAPDAGSSFDPDGVSPPARDMAQVRLADLGKQEQKVYGLILQGGPFAFDKDGTVFGNRERLLPRQPRGYYREYTVGSGLFGRVRGVKRIVCGGQTPTKPDVCYYTTDHYDSFRRIVAGGKG